MPGFTSVPKINFDGDSNSTKAAASSTTTFEEVTATEELIDEAAAATLSLEDETLFTSGESTLTAGADDDAKEELDMSFTCSAEESEDEDTSMAGILLVLKLLTVDSLTGVDSVCANANVAKKAVRNNKIADEMCLIKIVELIRGVWRILSASHSVYCPIKTLHNRKQTRTSLCHKIPELIPIQ
ncbi:MAG TPA: hypothetical protein VLF09_08205 [Cellvibrio sp.]|nr:hypothetical protein [Cellvibrio sp.]